MGIRIDNLEAKRRLQEAADWAASDLPVSVFWYEATEHAFRMQSKTYVAALGTALLARSVDDRVDPLSIKSSYSDSSYSLRTLAHSVLVPSAKEMKFSLRVTGREPINNQPFFRYDHMDLIDRVRNISEHQHFVDNLRTLSLENRSSAIEGLASFLRYAFLAHGETYRAFAAPANYISFNSVLSIIRIYTSRAALERPKRLQALVAAVLDVGNRNILTRKLNDPSRDFPGDIHLLDCGVPQLAVEVRGKPVTATEIAGFVQACRMHDISKACVVIDSFDHSKLDISTLIQMSAHTDGVSLTVFENIVDFFVYILNTSSMSQTSAIETFLTAAEVRLREMEVDVSSLAEWSDLVTASEK